MWHLTIRELYDFVLSLNRSNDPLRFYAATRQSAEYLLFSGNENVKVTRQLTGLDSQTLNPVIRLVIVFLLFTLYIPAFRILYPLYRALTGAPSFSTFITLPALAAAYLFGIKAGLVAWFIS